QVYNTTGKLIYQTQLNSNVLKYKIPVQSTGIYIVNILSANQVTSKKVFLD
ncbi:MAG: T9SS type A sorting domain-containing protein, partial [Flavobacteriales bacterium]|nr:T9SS type A sorting domain-containing protein [Flavobacteriales bacterium]